MSETYNFEEYTFNNLPKEKWENFLASTQGTSVMHSVEFLQWVNGQGGEVFILATETSSKIIAAIIATDFSIFGGFNLRSYYPLGPFNSFISIPNVSGEISKNLINTFEKRSSLISKCLCVKLSDFGGRMTDSISTVFSVETHTGFVINLGPEKVIFARFSDSLKRYLNKFFNTISIVDVSGNDMDELYELFTLRDKKINIKSFPKSYYESFLTLSTRNIVEWKVARIENKIVATAIFWNNSDEIVYSDSAMDQSAFPQIYPKVESIIWSIMQTKSRTGYKRLILGESIGQKNFTEFKNKWGAEEIKYNVYYKNTFLYNMGYKFQPIVKKLWRPY